MRRTLISLGVAFLVLAIVYTAIFFLDPGMNVEKAYNILVLSFIGAGIVTALGLQFRKRRR